MLQKTLLALIFIGASVQLTAADGAYMTPPRPISHATPQRPVKGSQPAAPTEQEINKIKDDVSATAATLVSPSSAPEVKRHAALQLLSYDHDWRRLQSSETNSDSPILQQCVLTPAQRALLIAYTQELPVS